jgi:hypothetical protein
MNSDLNLTPVEYNPDRLLNALIDKLKVKNDFALSFALEVAPSVISKIRHRKIPVSASMLLRMNEITYLSIKDLRLLMGDRRRILRSSSKAYKPKQVADV